MRPALRMTETEEGGDIKFKVTLDWSEEIRVSKKVIDSYTHPDITESMLLFIRRARFKLIADLTADVYKNVNKLALLVGGLGDEAQQKAIAHQLDTIGKRLRGDSS